MSREDSATLKWLGAAHFQITCGNTRLVTDPLYSRLPGDLPRLKEDREQAPAMDAMLLTHGHWDHSADFPFLLARHKPRSYAPEKYIQSLAKEPLPPGMSPDLSLCTALEDIAGQPFSLGDVQVSAHRIGTEKIDLWFIRSMFVRPWRHKKPSTVPFGFQWLGHHLAGNCFAYHFTFPSPQTTLLFLGNLTDEVGDLSSIQNVDILALPYCPSNNKWREHTSFLMDRFSPRVTLVHHYDNFMDPYTRAKYINLADYKKAIAKTLPNAALYFAKFFTETTLEEILGS